MDRKTRICIWIIIVGLVNFIVFTMIYIALGGDAKNGRVEKIDGRWRFLIQMRGWERRAAEQAASAPDVRKPFSPVMSKVYVSSTGILYKDIGKGWFLYSGIHSIVIVLTVGAVLLAMLTLAKDHIVTAMEDRILKGRALITIFATVVVLATTMVMVLFIIDFWWQVRLAL